MDAKLQLTPMELYFCAKLMNAKYYDYAYLAAMPDIQKQYALREQETMEQLEEKELIEMDFDDNIDIDEEVKELLSPVFFGEKESRLAIEGRPDCRFHIQDDRITMTVLDAGRISISQATQKEMCSLLKASKVKVYLADIKVGQTARVFTAAELKDKAVMEKAVRLLKGEL